MRKINTLTIILILCSIIFLTGCVNELQQPVKGELFLEKINNGDLYTLGGEWEFYWEGLYRGEDFNNPDISVKKKYIDYRTNWYNAVIDGWKVPEYGYATYRAIIKYPADIKDHIFIRIPNFDMGVNIYCNNNIIFSNGTVGKTAESSRTVNYFPFIAEVFPENGVIELVIHASNFKFPRGGIRDSIVIGSRESIISFNDITISVEMIIIGCLLIMSLYNLILFILIKNKYITLYFSIVCLTSAINMMVNGSAVLGKMGLPWEHLSRVHYISWIVSVYFFYRYFTELFEKYSYKYLRVFFTVSTTLICLTILSTPINVFNHLYYPIMLIYIFIYGFSILISILEFKAGSENSSIFFVSFLILFVLMLIDSLPYMGINQINAVVPAGMLLFCIIQSFIIGKDIYNQYSANSKLSIDLGIKNSELNELNDNLETIVLKRTDDLNKEKEKVVEQNRIINNLNAVLKDGITDALAQVREKNDMMMLQSRLASMGEMTGFIGHQWKQNIYAISLYTEALKNILNKKGKLDAETANDPLDKIDSFIIEMYNNLNDFMDFIKPVKEIEYFSISDTVNETLNLMSDYLTINSTEIIREYKKEHTLTGFSNELKQVVMNLLKNSVDAFVSNKSKDRLIVISVYSDDKNCFLSIKDNAGGIHLDNPDAIFNKFHTSKSEGAGLGLYLSRIIIEQRFKGKIEVLNKKGGVEFIISIPVSAEDIIS